MDLDLANLVTAVALGAIGFLGGRASERRFFRLSASSFAADYFRDLRSWACEAIDVLTEAAYCSKGRADSTPVDSAACFRCKHRLSALIDRGRFFIPNLVPESTGTEKPMAYRGIRHPALDLLVAAEQVLAGEAPVLKQFPSHRAALVEIKREFVSLIQEILDPRTRNKELAALLRDGKRYPDRDLTALERLGAGGHTDFSDLRAAVKLEPRAQGHGSKSSHTAP